MKILLAPDKFKGSLSAYAVCDALRTSLERLNIEDLEVIAKPLADGGDGSLAVLANYLDCETVELEVNDPLMRPIIAQYLRSNNTAYIEMARASGLVLLEDEEKNCLYTTSYGTGQMIADAIEKGANEIYLFIGGSATNDGGIGIASALGYDFFDDWGNLLKPIGENLPLISKIDDSQVSFDSETVMFRVVCDVDNPLYGKNGAAHIYAYQKGANADEVNLLDNGLRMLATQLKIHNYPDIAETPGAGAAGGTGGGMIAFLGATLISGIDTFFEITQFEKSLKKCDLVITGEGKIDEQSLQGKVIKGVSHLADKHGIPVIAVCGMSEENIAGKLGLRAIYDVMNYSDSLKDAMENAREKLERIGEDISKNLLKNHLLSSNSGFKDKE